MFGVSFRMKWEGGGPISKRILDGNVLTKEMSPGDPEIQKQEVVDISCLKKFFSPKATKATL